MRKVSRLSSIAQVRVSTTAVRVEKFVPAYESPLTNTVQATMCPEGETRARVGMPAAGKRWRSRRCASSTTAR